MTGKDKWNDIHGVDTLTRLDEGGGRPLTDTYVASPLVWYPVTLGAPEETGDGARSETVRVPLVPCPSWLGGTVSVVRQLFPTVWTLGVSVDRVL